jgi:hypothetical protein
LDLYSSACRSKPRNELAIGFGLTSFSFNRSVKQSKLHAYSSKPSRLEIVHRWLGRWERLGKRLGELGIWLQGLSGEPLGLCGSGGSGAFTHFNGIGSGEGSRSSHTGKIRVGEVVGKYCARVNT